MKKIFLFLLLIISFVSYGQTYNPANFTVSNKSYGVAQAVPTDARSQFYDATNFVMRDYQSTTEVNSYLNLAKYRTGHFLIYIHNGGSLSSGVWTGGTTDIYIYKDGVLDANLVPLFTNTTLSNTGSGFRIVKPISGSDYPLRSLASSNTIIWDSTSNSNSLTGKVDTSLIVTINRLSDTAASIRLAISAGGGGITTLTGDVTASGTGTVAATIANNAVSNAKFRQSAALSVVGRTSNSTGNVADIAAATSGHVLRRNGTTLDFGTIDSVSVPLLHSEAYYNTKYPTIGSDSVYIKAATNTGTSIFFIDADTLKLKRLQAGSNVTLTSNADSSITIAASGGGGSQTFAQVLATGRTLPTNDSVGLSGKTFKFYGNSSNVATESLILGKRQFDNSTNAGWNPLFFEPLSSDTRASSFYFKHNQTAQSGTFPNNVMKIGWNPDLVETNKKGLWIAMESNYQTTPTDSIQEFHISSQGTTWGETRLLSYTLFNRNGLLGENQTTNIFSNLDLRAESINFLTTTNRSFASISQNKTSRVSAITLQSGSGVALNVSADSAQSLVSFNQQFGSAPRAVDFFRDGATRDLNFYNFRVTTNAGVEFQGYAGVNTDSTHDFGGYATRWKRFYAGQVGMNRQLVGNLAAWGNHFLSGELIKHTPYADNRSVFMRMTNAAGSSTIYSILNDGTLSIPTGGYDYSRSVWQPSLTFAGRDTTGFFLNTGNILTFVDRGNRSIGFFQEGGNTDVIYSYASNRLSIESTGALNHVSLVGRMEYEGLGNGGYIDWIGYQAGSSLGRTIRITTDAASYGNSVVPIHFVPRNGFHAFRITDSVNAVKMHFNAQGWLGIGNDTATTPIHVRSLAASDADGSVITLDGVNLSNQGIRTRYWSGGSPVTIWEEIANFNTGEIKNFIKSGGGYFHTWYSNGTKSMTLNNSGELQIGSATDNGAFTLQNTGGLYQQGSFRLGGTRVATSNDVKLLVKGESDSTVAQLDYPIVQSTYSVTLTNTTNIASSSTNTTYYERRGNVIHVWGTFTAAATAGGSVCELGFSIPVASGFTNVFDLGGSGSSDTVPVKIIADATNDRAKFRFTPANTSSTEYSFHFTYWYIAP